jgi:hypothetical protein
MMNLDNLAVGTSLHSKNRIEISHWTRRLECR